MAEEVEMIPVTGAEPPKTNPLAKPAAPQAATLKLNPVAHKPIVAGAGTPALKPGLKLPEKPGASALKPGLKLPPKPVIRKPGTAAAAAPLPKPAVPPPVAPAPAAAAPAPAAAAPAAKPMDALKSMTQKMKGTTQEIPQQAILRKTGIIADTAMSDAQKEAAKHKTARISLSDAMGVAPVKEENAPMKTIRIKRPTAIAGATASLAPKPKADAAAAEPAEAAPAETASDATVTQRKTLKITRPGGSAVRPGGKFGLKRPGTSTAGDGAAAGDAAAGGVDGNAVADIPDMPAMPIAPVRATPASDGPAWLWALSAMVQLAACVAIGALAWFLWENTTTNYF